MNQVTQEFFWDPTKNKILLCSFFVGHHYLEAASRDYVMKLFTAVIFKW
jgi:hypothetical protein